MREPTYACDTHYPWKTQDLIVAGALTFSAGSVEVPRTPGLGVELDRDMLAVLHEQWQVCGFRERADTGYMRSIEPVSRSTRHGGDCGRFRPE